MTQVMNDDVAAFAKAICAAGEHPEVVLEATYGWYWAADLLAELGSLCTSRTRSATTGDTGG